jgi:hypothetical protein
VDGRSLFLAVRETWHKLLKVVLHLRKQLPLTD